MRRPFGRPILWALLIVPLLLAGCWDRAEVETLAFITATGIDLVPPHSGAGTPPRIELTARVMNTAGSATSGSSSGVGGERNLPSVVVTGRGVTTWDALYDMQKTLGWTLFVAHNRVVVLASEVPRSGQMRRVMDFFDRARQTRRNAYLLVADGSSAAEIIDGYSPLTGPDHSDLHGLVLTSYEQRGTPLVTINDFLIRLALEGVDPIAGRIRLTSSTTSPSTGQGMPEAEQSPGNNSPAEISGVALFQGDRLVGFLDEEPSHGLLWATNRSTGGMIAAPCPREPDLFFFYVIQRASARLSIQTHPELRGRISIIMEGIMGDIECTAGGFRTDTKELRRIEDELTRIVHKWVQEAVDKAQELHADPFGFGAALMRRDYRLWQQVKDHWHDTVWAGLPVDVDATVYVRRSGIVGTPYEVR